jgi:hypothetical protein
VPFLELFWYNREIADEIGILFIYFILFEVFLFFELPLFGMNSLLRERRYRDFAQGRAFAR